MPTPNNGAEPRERSPTQRKKATTLSGAASAPREAKRRSGAKSARSAGIPCDFEQLGQYAPGMYHPAKRARLERLVLRAAVVLSRAVLLSSASLLWAGCGDSVLVARELGTDVDVSHLEPSNSAGPGRGVPNASASDHDFPVRGKGKVALQRRAAPQNDSTHTNHYFIDHDDQAETRGGADAGTQNHE
jgi:hypothetical protein